MKTFIKSWIPILLYEFVIHVQTLWSIYLNPVVFLYAFSLYQHFIIQFFPHQHIIDMYRLYIFFFISIFFERIYFIFLSSKLMLRNLIDFFPGYSLYFASYFYNFLGGSWVGEVDTFFHKFTQTGPIVPLDVPSARALWNCRPMDQDVGHL